MSSDYRQEFIDAVGDLAGRDFATHAEAAAWLFSHAGQQRMAEWVAEDDGVIWVPETALRPFDQVLGDREGVDREALPPGQRAEIAVALAEIEGNATE